MSRSRTDIPVALVDPGLAADAAAAGSPAGRGKRARLRRGRDGAPSGSQQDQETRTGRKGK